MIGSEADGEESSDAQKTLQWMQNKTNKHFGEINLFKFSFVAHP